MKPVLLAILALGVCAPAFAQTKSLKLPGAAVPAPAPTAGRFRITVTGFDVVEQTWDDAMQRDGKDDEVFLVAEARTVSVTDGHPSAGVNSQFRTQVMGDTNNFIERIRAGSASDDGGLRTGDSVPARGSHFRRGEPRLDRLPLLLWEGELRDDNPVMLVPTIWEWDGPGGPLDGLLRSLLAPIDTLGASSDSAHFDKRREGLIGHDLRGYIPGVVARLSEVSVGRNVVGEHAVQEMTVVGSAGDRPIGMELDEDSRYHFNPWVVTLGYSDAVYTTTHDAGSGPGVIKLPYVDGPALHGKYTLYLQVEQLP